MSPKAQIPSHRKPRERKMPKALRAGMTGGVMGTIALTAAAAPAVAGDKSQAGGGKASETVEMPALTGELASSTQQAVDSMETSAERYELQVAQEKAAAAAHKEAKETKQKAEAKKRAEAARKAEARERAEQARADRSSERTTLDSATDSEQSTPASTEAGSGSAAEVLSFLRAQVGKAYVLGGTGPSSYDCSGLTAAAFKQVGVDLPRMSQQQSTTGTQVSVDEAQPGDILYWGGSGSAHHVAVYVGDGKFIGAQNSSTGVVERDLSYDQPTGAVRVL
ncbi:C40 family peptidase [Streptomyces sulphureus]|uniref:C40 family peptidase n=1 Tax=Streptomyces sulphureus TaxID=47758 RepID=UPI00039D3035|nr:C40 family peptidase [Streptomyces sulphureus]